STHVWSVGAAMLASTVFGGWQAAEWRPAGRALRRDARCAARRPLRGRRSAQRLPRPRDRPSLRPVALRLVADLRLAPRRPRALRRAARPVPPQAWWARSLVVGPAE